MKCLTSIKADNNAPTLLFDAHKQALIKSQALHDSIIRLDKHPRGFKKLRQFHVNNVTKPEVINSLRQGLRYAFVGGRSTLCEYISHSDRH